MAILGIGCDILSLARLRGVIIRRGADKLAARILSKTEALEYTTARITSSEWTPDRAERFLGTRWAVKEAAYKALYPQVKAKWKDLALVRGAGGVKPELVWEGLPAQAKGLSMHCSLSHDADLVMAYVIVERNDKTSGDADAADENAQPAEDEANRPTDDEILAQLTQPR